MNYDDFIFRIIENPKSLIIPMINNLKDYHDQQENDTEIQKVEVLYDNTYE